MDPKPEVILCDNFTFLFFGTLNTFLAFFTPSYPNIAGANQLIFRPTQPSFEMNGIFLVRTSGATLKTFFNEVSNLLPTSANLLLFPTFSAASPRFLPIFILLNKFPKNLENLLFFSIVSPTSFPISSAASLPAFVLNIFLNIFPNTLPL